MRTVFADTFYFLAILNRSDEAHDRCNRFVNTFRGRILTTDYILLELADALASPKHRVRTAQFIRGLRQASLVTVISTSDEILRQALILYESRPDKEWSLTVCTSFVVMQQEGLTEAATGDNHFEQAGYKPLFL